MPDELVVKEKTIITPPLMAMVPFRVEGQGEGESRDCPPPLNPRPPGAGKFLRSKYMKRKNHV
jgi:hypothetical protein